jgi:hypothetical protein
MSSVDEFLNVIRVPETPLPTALTDASEFAQMSKEARSEFLAHVRFMQAMPYKMREWLERGSKADELRALVLRIDLDISVHLGIPPEPRMESSAFAIRDVWVNHRRPLASWLTAADVSTLNMSVPNIAASLSEVTAWVEQAAGGLCELFDGFFNATEYDGALAYLVAIHVYMAGIKFGLGRIEMRYPR